MRGLTLGALRMEAARDQLSVSNSHFLSMRQKRQKHWNTTPFKVVTVSKWYARIKWPAYRKQLINLTESTKSDCLFPSEEEDHIPVPLKLPLFSNQA